MRHVTLTCKSGLLFIFMMLTLSGASWAQTLAFSEVVLEDDSREITIFTNNTSINLADYDVVYTVNGTRPSRNNGNVYEGPFVVNRTTRVMAVIYDRETPLTGLVHSYNVTMASVMFGFSTGSLNLPVDLDQTVRSPRAIAAGNNYSIVAAGPWDVRMYGFSPNASAAFESLSPENPDPITTPSTIALAAGAGFGLALRSNGTVVGWGDNSFGQTNTSSLTNVVAIAAGSNHGLALHANGTVSAWGLNLFDVTRVPQDLTNVIAIDAGELFSAALLEDGTVRVWGSNESGVVDVPAGLTNVVQISAGGDHIVALKDDGSLVGWGVNLAGRHNFPAVLPPIMEVIAGAFTHILTESGAVFRVGNGTLTPFNQNEGVMRVFGSDTHVISLLREAFYVEPVLDFSLSLRILSVEEQRPLAPMAEQTLLIGTTSNVSEIPTLNQFAPPPPPGASFMAYVFEDNNYYFKNYRPTTVTENRWTIIASSPVGYRHEFRWSKQDLAAVPGTFVIRQIGSQGVIQARNMRTNESFSTPHDADVEIIHFYEEDFTQTYTSGWNLISNPNISDIENPLSVFQPAHANSLFAFNPVNPNATSTQLYTEETEMNQQRGYWLRFTGNASVTFSPPFRDYQEIESLVTGWHLIASPGYPFMANEIQDTWSILVDGRVYGYNFGYQEVTQMQPGRGYWIHVDATGKPYNILRFSAQNSIGNNQKRRYIEPGGFTRVQLGHQGNTQTFLLDGSLESFPEIHPRSFDLPPMPPLVAFDARFTNGANLSELNQATIRIQSPGAQLSLQNTSEDARRVLITLRRNGTQAVEEYTLDPGEEIEVNGQGLREIQVESVQLTSVEWAGPEVPMFTTLEANYPNPFNPTTSIRFSLASEQRVSLRVYNMLGQQVAELVNDVRAAGQHQVSFDGTGLASGMYIYRLEAGGMVLNRSMTLVK